MSSSNTSKPSATLVPLFSKIYSPPRLTPHCSTRFFPPSSFGIAKVLPFPFPTKSFSNFFLPPHFNTLIPTKKNIVIYYHDALENRCFLRFFCNSGKTFSVFDRAIFALDYNSSCLLLPKIFFTSSLIVMYSVFINVHKAFSTKQISTLRRGNSCETTVDKKYGKQIGKIPFDCFPHINQQKIVLLFSQSEDLSCFVRCCNLSSEFFCYTNDFGNQFSV